MHSGVHFAHVFYPTIYQICDILLSGINPLGSKVCQVANKIGLTFFSQLSRIILYVMNSQYSHIMIVTKEFKNRESGLFHHCVNTTVVADICPSCKSDSPHASMEGELLKHRIGGCYKYSINILVI